VAAAANATDLHRFVVRSIQPRSNRPLVTMVRFVLPMPMVENNQCILTGDEQGLMGTLLPARLAFFSCASSFKTGVARRPKQHPANQAIQRRRSLSRQAPIL
jgi:hypothetical protein